MTSICTCPADEFAHECQLHGTDAANERVRHLKRELTRAYAHHKECHDASVDRENALRKELADAKSNQQFGWDTAREAHKVYEKEHSELLRERERRTETVAMCEQLQKDLADARSKQFDPAIHITDVHADNIALRDVLEKCVRALENHQHKANFPHPCSTCETLTAACAELAHTL